MGIIYISYALYDEADRLIYVEAGAIDEMILYPHSKITYKGPVFYWTHEYFRQQGLTPVRADGSVYLQGE